MRFISFVASQLLFAYNSEMQASIVAMASLSLSVISSCLFLKPNLINTHSYLRHVVWSWKSAVALIFLPYSLTAQVIPIETPLQDPASSSTPAIYNSEPQWLLLGCYNELDADADARALGPTGSYLTPPAAPPDNLTVPACLDACTDSLLPNGGGRYKCSGVENGRYVL